ncbi:MAG: YIP1 family protein [Ignavibacteriaceae bacterium]|nr:YIP1 family protein [Ignavibacteriaceae bacterium]
MNETHSSPGDSEARFSAPAHTDSGPSPVTRFFRAIGLSPEAYRLPYRRSDWLVPLLIVLLLHLGSGIVLRDLFVQAQIEQVRAMLESNPRLSAEQKEEAIEQMTGGTAADRMGWGAVAGSVVMPVIGALLGAAVLLLILNFGAGGSVRYGPLWFLMTLSLAPTAIHSVLFTILSLSRGSVEVAFGPAALLPSDAGWIRTFLQTFDFFGFFWVFATQYVGVPVVTGLRPRKARTGLVILWIAYVLFALLGALASGCAMTMGGGGA